MKKNELSKELLKINHKTMADIVEIRLREYLKLNAFKPGDALPKETDLAEALGVSRNVVREALSRLRMLGIILTKRKRGMVMGQLDIMVSFERVLDPMFIGERTLNDIFEMRLTIEMGLADLLYMRKKQEDIDELHKIALNDIDHSGENLFRIKQEIAFHGKIYQMTGNETMQKFQSLLLPIFGYIVALEKEPILGKISHLNLVERLQHGSKEEFRQGMFLHLEHHFNKVK